MANTSSLRPLHTTSPSATIVVSLDVHYKETETILVNLICFDNYVFQHPVITRGFVGNFAEIQFDSAKGDTFCVDVYRGTEIQGTRIKGVHDYISCEYSINASCLEVKSIIKLQYGSFEY